MDTETTTRLAHRILSAVFGRSVTYTIDQVLDRFAYDVYLPRQVTDIQTHAPTWTDATTSGPFISEDTSLRIDAEQGWLRPHQDITSLDQLLALWQDLNITNAERGNNSINVACSDTIYRSENIYRSTNCNDAKNLVFCDSCGNSEFLLACSRSFRSSFCIRTDDSIDCSNCFETLYSSKIANSLFIQDCFDLYECLFCAHIVHQKYCIANMPFDPTDYFTIKNTIIDWILT